MFKQFSLIAFLFVLLVPSVQSIVWVPECVNESYLTMNATVILNGTTRQDYEQPLIFCENGCDDIKNVCSDPYNVPAEIISSSLMLYVIMLIMGFAAIIIGMERKEAFLVIFATLLFLVLTLQSLSFDFVFRGTAFAGLTGVFTGVCLLMTVIGLFFSLSSMVNRFKEQEALKAGG